MRRADEAKAQNYTKYFDACFKNTYTSRAHHNQHDEEVIHMLQPYVEIMDEDNNHRPDLVHIACDRFIRRTVIARRETADTQDRIEMVGRRWNVRAILHRHYRTTRTEISVRQLLQHLRQAHPTAGIPMDDLKAALPRLGFRVASTRNKNILVVEQHKLRLERTAYLRVMQLARKHRKPIVYFSEASVEIVSSDQPSTSTAASSPANRLVLLFAANRNGLINFTFAHKQSREITADNFIDWLQAVVQNLSKGTVLVVEQKHYTQPMAGEFYQPTQRELLRWLKIHDVQYEEEWTMVELRNAIRHATHIDSTKRLNFLHGIKDSGIELAAKQNGCSLVRIPR